MLAFSTVSHLQTESGIYQGIFVHVIPVRIIVPMCGSMWKQEMFTRNVAREH